jgi:hypothetical protein
LLVPRRARLDAVPFYPKKPITLFYGLDEGPRSTLPATRNQQPATVFSGFLPLSSSLLFVI